MEYIDGGAGTDVVVLTGFAPGQVQGSTPDFSLDDPITGGTYVPTSVEYITFQ